MAQSFSTANLQALLAYPFRDPDWKNKFLLGSLIVLAGFAIPLLPFIFIYGYMLQIMRRIIVEGGEPFLPAWDDWGKLFNDGSKLFGVVVVYTLPLMVLVMLGVFLFTFSIWMPIMFAGPAAGGENPPDVLFPLAGGLGMTVCIGLGLLLGLGLSLVVPAAMGHVAATNDFAAAFRWREWWPIFRANLPGFLLADLVLWAVSLVLNIIVYVSLILCCLLPFVAAPITIYTLLIYSALFAQAYRDGARQLTK